VCPFLFPVINKEVVKIMHILDNVFDLGQTVYLKTDKDQIPRIITAIQLNDNGLLYRSAQGTNEYWSTKLELSKENVLNPEVVGS
jgi:hypothetical protein